MQLLKSYLLSPGTVRICGTNGKKKTVGGLELNTELGNRILVQESKAIGNKSWRGDKKKRTKAPPESST